MSEAAHSSTVEMAKQTEIASAPPKCGIPGLPLAEIEKAKQKQVRKSRNKRNKQKLGAKETEVFINELFTPAAFKSVFAQQEERRQSLSGKPRVAINDSCTDSYDGSSDSDNLFGVSIPSSIAYNADQVSSAKTLSKFNIGENFSQLTSQEKVNEKRVASSPADGDIPPKRSGIPRLRQVHTAQSVPLKLVKPS